MLLIFLERVGKEAEQSGERKVAKQKTLRLPFSMNTSQCGAADNSWSSLRAA